MSVLISGKVDIDLANIVLIGLAENLPEKEERYELHRLLGALLSAKLDVETKFGYYRKRI
ncbi:MAG: hypothetical protein ACLTS6_13735 [Anaerobutyricum sp.]